MKKISFEEAVEITEGIYLNKLSEEYPHLNFCCCNSSIAVRYVYELVDKKNGFNLFLDKVIKKAEEDIIIYEELIFEELCFELNHFDFELIFLEECIEAVNEYSDSKIIATVIKEESGTEIEGYISKSDNYYFLSPNIILDTVSVFYSFESLCEKVEKCVLNENSIPLSA